MSQENNIRVTLILPVPIFENIPYYEGSIPKTLCQGKLSRLSYKDYSNENKEIITQANILSKKFKNFNLLSVGNIFCSPVCKISTQDKHPYYFDDDHLTLTGSELLKPVFIEALNNSKK